MISVMLTGKKQSRCEQCPLAAGSSPPGATLCPGMTWYIGNFFVGTPFRTQKRAGRQRAFTGGDGGNRTRVRKTRPSEIYERSRLGMSPQVIQPANLTCGQSLGPEGPLSRSQRHHARHSTFVTPNPFTGWSTGRVDAASARRPAVLRVAYAARGIAA